MEHSPCLGQDKHGGGEHPDGRTFPVVLAGGSGGSASQTQSPLLCVMHFAYVLTRPPTVPNPQNYSYFNVKWKPRCLAVPAAGARAPLLPSVANRCHVAGEMLGCAGSVCACAHVRTRFTAD